MEECTTTKSLQRRWDAPAMHAFNLFLSYLVRLIFRHLFTCFGFPISLRTHNANHPTHTRLMQNMEQAVFLFRFAIDPTSMRGGGSERGDATHTENWSSVCVCVSCAHSLRGAEIRNSLTSQKIARIFPLLVFFWFFECRETLEFLRLVRMEMHYRQHEREISIEKILTTMRPDKGDDSTIPALIQNGGGLHRWGALSQTPLIRNSNAAIHSKNAGSEYLSPPIVSIVTIFWFCALIYTCSLFPFRGAGRAHQIVFIFPEGTNPKSIRKRFAPAPTSDSRQLWSGKNREIICATEKTDLHCSHFGWTSSSSFEDDVDP